MIAFENALASGVEHIETDVHVSADGIVHCFHDDTTNRVTGVPGRFSEMTSGEIARLDAGYHHRGQGGFEFRFRGITIPTFEELVSTFPNVRIVVDLKDDEVVEPLARTVDRLGVGDRLVVGSFDDSRIARFRDHIHTPVATSTGVATTRAWFVASRSGRGVSGPASALQIPLQMRGLQIVDEKLIDVVHESGLQIHVWTVNDPRIMQRLVKLGVDGIVTDRPDLAVGAIKD
jgi:glycerophosphoryl diester phosphodiesterase